MRRVRHALSIATLVVVACVQETRFVQPGSADTTGGEPPGTVQKAALSLNVSVIQDDSAIAVAIGATPSALDGAAITIRRTGSVSEFTDTTDAAGSAHFADLVPGTYSVAAIRVLTADEIAQLPPSDADVNAFGGGRTVSVTAPTTEATIQTAAGRRGSLVISEVFIGLGTTPEGGSYRVGTYIEVYNNSDTTIYLDGKVVGRGMSHVNQSTSNPCSEFERWRNDPEGIWSRNFYQFPGAGRTYPLLPGIAAVVATDAIDHAEFVPGLPNLTGADFEFIGPSDVNNPGVPNMINIGPGDWAAGVIGHGLDWVAMHVAFVADSLTASVLASDNLPLQDPEYRRIPAEKLLDVFTSAYPPGTEARNLAPPCPQLVHERFDNQFAELVDFDIRSVVRRPFGAVEGRTLLQRTKTSSRDFFVLIRPTPGTVP